MLSLASFFKAASYIAVTNDSSDDTGEILQRWCARHATARLINMDGIGEQYSARTMRIAAARNRYLDIVRQEAASYDYMIVVDLDEVSVDPFNVDMFLKAIQFLNTTSAGAAVFPTQLSYYDVFALRHETLCPNCIFEEAFDKIYVNQIDAKTLWRELFWQRCSRISAAFNNAEGPIEVQSAFGGLGIYKMSSVLRNKRRYIGHKVKTLSPSTRQHFGFKENDIVGWQICEHVEFNRGFVENGEKLYVLPGFVNSSVQSLNIEQWEQRGLSFIDEKIFSLPR